MENSIKRPAIIIGTSIFLLCMPILAMQFTNEVEWTVSDFIVMGILLFAAGGLLELTCRLSQAMRYRAWLCAFILVGFLLVWAELAIGVFGTPFAGN